MRSPPLLYNIYNNNIWLCGVINAIKGIKIGGRRFSNLRFAGDTPLIANRAEEMLELLQRLEDVTLENCLKINVSKTNVMTEIMKIKDNREKNL